MPQFRVDWFLDEDGVNPVLSWILLAVAAFAGFRSFREGNLTAAGGAVGLVLVASVPAVASRKWQTTFSWPLVLLATLPTHVIAFGPDTASRVATAASIATLALVLVIDLHFVTRVRLSTGFTTVFILVATTGLVGFWAIFAWTASETIGGSFAESNDELMENMLLTVAAGIALAGGFEAYARGRILRSEADTA